MEEATQKTSLNVLKVAGAFFMFHLLGLVFPEALWGVHFPLFLPTFFTITLYLLVGGLILSHFIKHERFNSMLKGIGEWNIKWKLPIIGTALMGGMFYAFPIYHDVYGDAHFLKPGLENQIVEMTDTLWTYIFSFDFLDPKVGGKTTSGIVAALSYLTGATGKSVFIAFDAVCGMLFVFIWIRLVVELLTKNTWRLGLSLMGVLAPFFFMFYGHIELYSLAMVGMIAFLASAIFYLRRKKNVYLWLTLIFLILSLKFHITSFLMFPVAVLVIIYGREKLPLKNVLGDFRQLFKKVVLPIYGIGIALFFYLTNQHGNKRSFTEDTLEDALFIPFSSSEAAPLDRYNLFSGAHLSDYLNLTFVWSSAALFIIILAITFAKKQVDWKNPLVLFTGFSVLIYLPVFFVLNPLLTMSIDWDLFSLPAPFMLVFALILAAQLEKQEIGRYALGPIVGLALFGLPVIFVNANKDPLANRLEAVAKWDFKTYWIGTSYLVDESIGLRAPEEQQEIRIQILDELKPFAVEENDVEYAALLCNAGIYYLEEDKDLDKARGYFNLSAVYRSDYVKNRYYLATANIRAGEYFKAHELVASLVLVQYPSYVEALELAIEASVLSGNREDGLKYVELFLEVNPSDAQMQKLRDELQSQTSPTSLSSFFESSENVVNGNPEPLGVEAMLRRLETEKPASIQQDTSYARLLGQVGVYYQRVENDVPKALKYYRDAANYWPDFSSNIYNLVIGHFLLEDYTAAYQYVDDLVKADYPNRTKALKIAIHISVEAKEYEAAEKYCEEFLSDSPNDAFIIKVHEALKSGIQLEKVRFFFRQS
jgi:Tfp pilus assembly protein PilF